MNNNRWLQALIILLVIIAASWIAGQIWSLIIQFSSIILLFFLAWLVAFMLSPITRWLQARGVRQIVAIAAVYTALLLVAVLAGLQLVPVLVQQTTDLLNSLPAYTDQLQTQGYAFLDMVQKNWGLSVADIHLENLYGTIGDQVKNLGSGVLTFASGVASFLFNLVVMLLLSFYFMKDGDRMFNNAVALMPRGLATEVQLMGDSIARAFGGYLRGQLVFAVLYGLINAIIMATFNLQYILIVSIVAGVAMLIPLIGNVLAYLPPVLVMLVSPNITNWWILLIVLFVVQTIMLQVVGPRIMSQAIGIHPLFVFAALLLGLQVAGPWGAIFGVPVAGVLQQVAGPYFGRLRSFFNEPESAEAARTLRGALPGPPTAPLVEEPLREPVVILEPDPPAAARTSFRTSGRAVLVILVRGASRWVQAARRRPRAR